MLFACLIWRTNKQQGSVEQLMAGVHPVPFCVPFFLFSHFKSTLTDCAEASQTTPLSLLLHADWNTQTKYVVLSHVVHTVLAEQDNKTVVQLSSEDFFSDMYYLLKEMKTNVNDQTDGVKAYSNTECEYV